jgi:hypothetical protein
MTSLIVAFVAYSGVFGIHLVPAPAQSGYGDVGPALAVIDDAGR